MLIILDPWMGGCDHSSGAEEGVSIVFTFMKEWGGSSRLRNEDGPSCNSTVEMFQTVAFPEKVSASSTRWFKERAPNYGYQVKAALKLGETLGKLVCERWRACSSSRTRVLSHSTLSGSKICCQTPDDAMGHSHYFLQRKSAVTIKLPLRRQHSRGSPQPKWRSERIREISKPKSRQNFAAEGMDPNSSRGACSAKRKQIGSAEQLLSRSRFSFVNTLMFLAPTAGPRRLVTIFSFWLFRSKAS